MTLVPATVAPVPPPPRKRKLQSGADVENGGAQPQVLEDAPDKTLMEMLQSYLNNQDVYTRLTLIFVLMVLAGGVFGAYGVLVVYAVRDQKPKYIVLCCGVTLVFLWVLYKVSKSVGAIVQRQLTLIWDAALPLSAIK